MGYLAYPGIDSGYRGTWGRTGERRAPTVRGPPIRFGTFFADPIDQVMRYAGDRNLRGSLRDSFDTYVAFSRSPSYRTGRKLGLKQRTVSMPRPRFQLSWPIDVFVRRWKRRHDDHPPGALL